MTREQASKTAVDTRDLDYQIAVMQAFKAGAQIESRLRDRSSLVWQKESNPSWDWFSYEFRIKPTAKLRPWTADEVPVGGQMRRKANTEYRMLIDRTANHVVREDWFKSFEHSLDGGKTWLPCGVVEEVK